MAFNLAKIECHANPQAFLLYVCKTIKVHGPLTNYQEINTLKEV